MQKFLTAVFISTFCSVIYAQDWVGFTQKNTQDTALLPRVPQKTAKTAASAKSLPAKAKNVTYIHLEWADSLSYNQELTGDAQVLNGNVTFSHDGVFLYCDSACWFEANNSFNAFGNVVINQGDTLFVYGDVLYYDGNTKLARLRENVLMDNLTATLRTDSLNYDRAKNTGYYFNGGIIQDTLNTLTSETGYYYPDSKTALFRHNVVLENPDFIMKSDTLKYNTDTKIASIVGPTNIIYDKETHIYSEYGWYNTENEQSKLLLNSWVQHSSGKKLVGDTIFYDKQNGKGESFSNVEIVDTVKKVTLAGNYGYYIEQNEIGLVTDSAVMTEYSSEDTLFLHADTLYTHAEIYQIFTFDTISGFKIDTVSVVKIDTVFLNNEQMQELPLQAVPDFKIDTILTVKFDTVPIFRIDTVSRDSTLKVFQGYPNVRFFRTNVQGVCDSSYYNTRDSVLHLLKEPINWSDGRQLSGDTIRLFSKNGNVDKIVVTQNAFVCEKIEKKYFNQLSGKEIIGHIVENQLNKVEVRGNAESIYYPQDEEDKSITGQAKTISSIMNIYFTKEREIERIVLLPKPSGSMHPLKDVADNMLYLDNYSWQISKKPVSKFDIFRNTNAVVLDSLAADNQDVNIKPKKKTTRRDDIKPIEEAKKDGKNPTRSTDSNRPSGFATPSLGGGNSFRNQR
ncbi:MAG: hypothetical protein LBB53_00870 [Prevotellaceae bacterium]|jgi:lipopolysaccharide export system protein LptA|nr:hypothetical protein [Prevotellaceae bacterium]